MAHPTRTMVLPLPRRCAAAVVVLLGTLLAVVPQGPASAAVHVDDTPIAAWGVDGRVRATVIVGDTVIVGGNFRNAVSQTGQSVPRRNLAAFDRRTGALRTDWRADAGSSVFALVADGNDVYVGGAFGRVDGQTHQKIARIDGPSGDVDNTFRASLDNTVRAIAVDSSAVYVGGTFTTANGESRNRLARLRKGTGALDTDFQANTNNAVWGLAKHPSQSTLYLSGRFSTVRGVSRNGVAAVDSGTGAVRPVVFANAARPTLGLDVNHDGTRLFGAGGTGTNSMATWNTSTGARLWRHVAMGDIQVVRYFSGTVYFGFHDGFGGNTNLKVLAADAATGALDPDFRPTVNSFWGVFAIAASDDGLAIGGDFTRVSGVRAEHWAWFPSTSDPSTEPEPEPEPDPTTVLLAGPDTSWRYWDRGTRPDGWQTSAFDDSAWPSGGYQLGYGEGDEQTVVIRGPEGGQAYITTYYRTQVTAAVVPDVLTVVLAADDGALVHLNGVEVVRDNMPSGTITHDTPSATNRWGAAENARREFQVPPSALVVGTNTLAVELHQEGGWTSDASFELDLVAQSG